MEICSYYHDAQTAAVLSIDDLSFTAILENGQLMAANDWGYGLNESGSIYHYLEDTLLAWYPEVRGTIFFPIARRHGNQNLNAGHECVFRDDESEIPEFLALVQQRFELAFHGIEHGRYIDKTNPAIAGNWQQEFEYHKLEDVPVLKAAIEGFSKRYGIAFSGGKYPGYKGPEPADKIVEELGFLWWMRRSDMIGRRCAGNDFAWFGQGEQILDIPTNLESGMFRHSLPVRPQRGWRVKLKKKMPIVTAIWQNLQNNRREQFIDYLYENRLPLTIQSHFTSARTDGYRQMPALYDDMESLCHIYAVLRGGAIWHTTCGELARYRQSLRKARITKVPKAERKFKLFFINGQGDERISLRSQASCLLAEDGQELHGTYRRGVWVYDGVEAGVYYEARC